MAISIEELNQRSLDIFKELVDTFVETGEPVGSRTLSRRFKHPLSPATIRNIMADLEEVGLLYAPYTSAGRLPTEEGLRLFVNGLLQMGKLTPEELDDINQLSSSSSKNIPDVLEEVSSILSGLSKCAGLVLAPKKDSPLKHAEFVQVSDDRVLVILIYQDGIVENRLITPPKGVTASILTQATRYLSSKLYGKTLKEAKSLIDDDLKYHKEYLDELTTNVVKEGLAVWSDDDDERALIIKGQSNLLENIQGVNDLERIRSLFNVLETKELLKELLDSSMQAEGVQIFIGAENQLFKLSGCSLIISSYHSQNIVGALGVIGPSRMNYSKIIPLVNYTAKIVERLLLGEKNS
ncbi:MAG: heat-inducible transcriptional repressor HrcA [Alphaproteobacteria bacterium]